MIPVNNDLHKNVDLRFFLSFSLDEILSTLNDETQKTFVDIAWGKKRKRKEKKKTNRR